MNNRLKDKKPKSEVRDKIGKEETSESSSYSDGVLEAMDDMVKASLMSLSSFKHREVVMRWKLS